MIRKPYPVRCPACAWPLSASYRMPGKGERMACCAAVLEHEERVDLLRQLTVARTRARRAA